MASLNNVYLVLLTRSSKYHGPDGLTVKSAVKTTVKSLCSQESSLDLNNRFNLI